MKKVLIFIIAITLCVGMVACGQEEQKTNNQSTTSEQGTAEAKNKIFEER